MRFQPSAHTPGFRISPDKAAPLVKARECKDNAVYTYADGTTETVVPNGARTFYKPSSDYQIIYKDGNKELVGGGQSKTFYPDNSVVLTNLRDPSVPAKLVPRDPNVEKNLFPNGTQIKRHIEERIEIRKNKETGEKLAGKVIWDKFFPFLKKDLNTGKITLLGEQPEAVKNALTQAQECGKFSNISKEVSHSMQDKGPLLSTVQDGTTTFYQLGSQYQIKYRGEPNNTKELVTEGWSKVFYPDNKVVVKIKISAGSPKTIKTAFPSRDIERDLWTNGTQVKRYLPEKLEIRKNLSKSEKLAGQVINHEFVPFMRKDMLTKGIALIGEQTPAIREHFNALAAEEGSKFSYIAREMLCSIKHPGKFLTKLLPRY